MSYLHSCAVLHRDLKSANLLLDQHDRVKVADFGVARRLGSHSGDSMTAETGTYRWMAPEVIKHAKYDRKVDVFSFGIVLWELLSGELPYAELSPLQAAAAVVSEGLRPALAAAEPPAPAPPLPGALQALMAACWALAPPARPEFTDVEATLATLLVDEESRGEDDDAGGSPQAGAGAGGDAAGAGGAVAALAAAAAGMPQRSSGKMRAAPRRGGEEGLPGASAPLDVPIAGALPLSALARDPAAAPAGAHGADGGQPRRRSRGLLDLMVGCCTAPPAMGTTGSL
jgi:hypothetical protein